MVDDIIQKFLRDAKVDIRKIIKAAFAAGRKKGRAEARRELLDSLKEGAEKVGADTLLAGPVDLTL